MVGGVIGICHNNHIILGGFGAHGIVADNHLPVSAPVVPADGDGMTLLQGLLDELKGEHIVDGIPAVQGGINIKAAHALEHLHHLRHGGCARGQAVAAELCQGFFIVVAPHSVPFQHHQCAADTAAPFAGLLLGLEMGENGQAVGAFHVVKVRCLEIGAVGMIALPLHAVGTVFRAQVAGVGNLHFIRGGICLGSHTSACQQGKANSKYKSKYN